MLNREVGYEPVYRRLPGPILLSHGTSDLIALIGGAKKGRSLPRRARPSTVARRTRRAGPVCWRMLHAAASLIDLDTTAARIGVYCNQYKDTHMSVVGR